jgi:hypothetical protein
MIKWAMLIMNMLKIQGVLLERVVHSMAVAPECKLTQKTCLENSLAVEVVVDVEVAQVGSKVPFLSIFSAVVVVQVDLACVEVEASKLESQFPLKTQSKELLDS